MRSRRGQHGFTLIEVIVAMIILTVGVLGLAASAGAVSRLSSEGVRSSGAAALSGAKLEELRATPCANLANGTQTTGAYTLTWTIATSGFIRTVTLVVSYRHGRGTRNATYVTELSCAPLSA